MPKEIRITMDLSQLRGEIDRIDSQIVELYEERMKVSSAIADYKIANGKKVFDKEREKEKIQAVKSLDKEKARV